MGRLFRFRIMFLLLLAFSISTMLPAESVVVVNRTYTVLDLMQAAPAGVDHWGDDLISDSVLEPGVSVVIDLIGEAPWSFRFVDSSGSVYVLYDVNPSLTGKVSVSSENLAMLSMIAGSERDITFTNRTGYTIVSLKVSAATDGSWGPDVLKGRHIRNGEARSLLLETTAGTLSYDISFTLMAENREVSYEKRDVILTDGASLVLSAP